MATQQKTLKALFHGKSDVGLLRDNNEDSWCAEPKNSFYILCDGMGGHLAGEVASQEAISVLSKLVKENLKKASLKRKSEILRELIQEVNAVIYCLGQNDRELRGMGTTLCCVLFHQSSMIVGHVGDSRVYLLRDKQLSQITEDHSLVAELFELGELNKRQVRECAYRNIITRAIGVEPRVEPSIQIHEVFDDDQILICSDGLSDMLALAEIEAILNKEECLKKAVDRLIVAANRRGGYDNITTLLIKLQGSS